MKQFKGYLHYKKITSQDVPSEVQVKIFFLFHRKKYIPFSRYSIFCIFNHPMINQICDLMMTISTWDRKYFWIYLLNHNSLTYQTSSIDRCKHGQYFCEIFWTSWRTGPKSHDLLNVAASSNYSKTNYFKFPVFQFFESLSKWGLKMNNINY